MAANITLPVNELNFIIKGDLDVLNASDISNGNGTVHLRNGGLYVEGLTDLDQTTINTSDGLFHVLGPNKIEFNISGGLNSSIEMTAELASFLTTTAGILTLSSTATDANGKVNIQAAGTGANSILLNATNAVSGQVTIQSAGGDVASDAVKVLASDVTNGNVLIQGSGTIAGVRLYADNTASGQVLLESLGASSTSDAIRLLATDITDGNVLIQGNGANTNFPAIKLFADNNTSGQIVLEADGDVNNAIRLISNGATGGGIDIDAVGGPITIDTTNISTGITIGTVTSGVPVTIGTGASVTTIAGDLLVQGTTTTIDTESLRVEDNLILLNAGNGELDLDSGVVVRRFQTANNIGSGNVATGTNPIQESGAFQVGSAVVDTLVLDAHASVSDDFYNGWWVKVTSGGGVDQVRRISDYVGSTKTATIFVTADNTVEFNDGLDLVTAPASGDTYNLYSDGYVSTYFNESEKTWSFANASLVPEPVSAPGASTVVIQQYQEINSGAVDIYAKIYRNVNGSASATTITFTLQGHGITVGNIVEVSNSLNFTPEITTKQYTVQTTPTANTFTILADASTTSVDASSATIRLLHTSSISVNIIQPHDPGFGINIPGLAAIEDITIPKISTDYFFLETTTVTYGAYFIMVADKDLTDGAFSIFMATRSGTSGSVSRLSAVKGTDGQRIDGDWETGEKFKIRHRPEGTGAGNYVYRIRVFSAI